MHRLLTLIKKEFQSLWRSPQSRRLLIVPVLLQTLIFPFAATLEVKNSTLAIDNQDHGAASAELIARFAAAKAFPKILMLHGDKEVKAALDQQQALLVIRFDSDFSRRVAAGENADIQALIDGRRSNSAQIAFGYARQIVQQYFAEKTRLQPAARLVVQHFYNPSLEYRWFVLPSLVAIITTIGCLMVTALSLAREKEEGTFEQLLVSPLTPAYIMLGKAVPGISVAILQGLVIATAAVLFYGVPFTGSLLVLLLGLFFYGLALSGCGLFISALCRNQQQAFLGVFSFMAPAIILSGYMAPIENMPWVLQQLSAANPLTHCILIVKGAFLKGYGLSDALPQFLALLLIASITLSFAYGMFRYRSLQ